MSLLCPSQYLLTTSWSSPYRGPIFLLSLLPTSARNLDSTLGQLSRLILWSLGLHWRMLQDPRSLLIILQTQVTSSPSSSSLCQYSFTSCLPSLECKTFQGKSYLACWYFYPQSTAQCPTHSKHFTNALSAKYVCMCVYINMCVCLIFTIQLKYYTYNIITMYGFYCCRPIISLRKSTPDEKITLIRVDQQLCLSLECQSFLGY